MRRLPLLYALGCTIWAAHIVQILASFHLSHPEARLGGALLCVLLVVVFPSLLGYVLLFRAFPWMSRLIRRLKIHPHGKSKGLKAAPQYNN